MLYVKRDQQGNLIRVESTPFTGMDAELAADSYEAQAWFAHQGEECSLHQLRLSDQGMIRVLEDLIDVLITKGVLQITDLPEIARAKLIGRSKARNALKGLGRLINDEEDPGLI